MRELNWMQVKDFLLESPRTAKLATTDATGRPHVVPVWFALDGDDIVFTTASSSAKARHIRRDPRVAISVDDETPPFAFVSLHGTAHAELRPVDLPVWTETIAARYVGADRAVEVGKVNAGLDDLVVRVSMTSVIAQAELVS